MTINVQVQLARQRDGVPEPDDFRLAEGPIPKAKDGQILVRTICLSLDPFIRKAMRGDHYGYNILAAGDVVYGRAVAEIIQSRNDAYSPGEHVVAETGWQQYASITEKEVVQKINPSSAPLSTAVGILGMPGLTAWASVMRLGRPGLGATAVVSAAAGPVGGTFGQLAKLRGARVVGLAGSNEKCEVVVKNYGFSACVNYKNKDWEEKLKAACPNGVDVYHDNSGGSVLQAMAAHLNLYSTVVLCGRPGDYNTPDFDGISLGPFMGKRSKLLGLVVYDYEKELDTYVSFASEILRKRRLTYKEDSVTGIENTPTQFVRLMKGETVGKAIVHVAAEKI